MEKEYEIEREKQTLCVCVLDPFLSFRFLHQVLQLQPCNTLGFGKVERLVASLSSLVVELSSGLISQGRISGGLE